MCFEKYENKNQNRQKIISSAVGLRALVLLLLLPQGGADCRADRDGSFNSRELKNQRTRTTRKTQKDSDWKRAILVHLQHGETLTSLIKKQKSQPGGCPTSGPLNFKNSILLWLRCDLDVLQKRLDDRVDDMMSRGLVDELLEFHKTYTAQAPEKLLGFNLRKGIYQSIGFKEFYDFLIMDEQNRDSEEGKKTLEKGVDMLKLVTRRYAKRQQKWIENRLLRNGQRELPPIYGFDATDVSKWKENVYSPAEDVVASYLEGRTPSLDPLPVENTKVIIDKMYKCECGTIAAGKVQYEVHLKSKNHLRKMKRLLKEKRDNAPKEAVESSC